MQPKDSATGYRSSFNSSLSAYLSIPSLLSLFLLSTPLSDLGSSVLQSQILHTRVLILIRKCIDQNLGFGLYLLELLHDNATRIFSNLRAWQPVDLPQKQVMHQVTSYTPLIESFCGLFHASYGLDKALSRKLMQATIVPWPPSEP